MTRFADATVDRVFISNFFEHIPREAIVSTLTEARRVLKPDGRLLVLQPNVRYCAKDYWMFFDHITPVDDRALAEAFRARVRGRDVLSRASCPTPPRAGCPTDPAWCGCTSGCRWPGRSWAPRRSWSAGRPADSLLDLPARQVEPPSRGRDREVRGAVRRLLPALLTSLGHFCDQLGTRVRAPSSGMRQVLIKPLQRAATRLSASPAGTTRSSTGPRSVTASATTRSATSSSAHIVRITGTT